MLRAASAALVVAAVAFAPAPAARADIVRDRQQPVLAALGVENAWRTTRGAGVTVAVIDSGVDPAQADLRGAVTTGPNYLTHIDRSSRPLRRHGTAMASLIAGRGHGPGGRDGIIGVAPQVKILAIRALAERGDPGYFSYQGDSRARNAVARGIRHAADEGADVINLSLGKYVSNTAEREAIGYAIERGVVVVAAAGNEGDEPRRTDSGGYTEFSYPAGYPGVITVAAATPEHRRAPFSNRNHSVVVAAPGVEIATAAPGGDYFLTDGTSNSTALVSGVVALIRAKYPRLTPGLVAQALVTSAQGDGYNPELGFGEVNAARALEAAAPLAGATPQGKPAAQRFGGETGPVAVIDRPFWLTYGAPGLSVAGLGGAAVAFFVVARIHGRARREP
ncbi:S8 family serine peptidase [Actinomadura craniellae]|uniref:S8 family serine peptidase n=1 Tax=Actinomadura craniellae TaxID=2231787 RepID=UPI001F3F8F55|nr:S8 family serine peptidase [Actinomadura craniellae]